MTLSGRARRKKGHDFERKIANVLREAFPEFAKNIKRTLQSRAGYEGSDVAGFPKHHFELKCGGKHNIKAALDQAIRDSKDTKNIPVTIIQYDRARYSLVSLRLDDYIDLLQRAFGFKEVFRGRKGTSGSRREALPRDQKARRIIAVYSNSKPARARKTG